MIHSFRRGRALTTAVILTLSIGVGVSAAMFNLVDVLFFRPPAHVIHPERIVKVPAINNYVRYRRLQRQMQTMDMAAYTRLSIATGRGIDAVTWRAECVTENYFALLGVVPIAGHGFSSDLTATDGRQPAIISYGLWQRLFAGAPDAIGANLELGGSRHAVAGVAPRNFTGVQMQAVDVWLGLTHSPSLCSATGINLLTSSNSSWLSTIARIRDPFTPEQAAAELATTDKQPFASRAAPATRLEPLAGATHGQLSRDSRIVLWLAGGALVVLLIASANVAVLVALRALERRLEVAVRMQLGATARRVFLLFFVENLALSLLCIAGALLVALLVDTGLRAFFPALPEARVNARSFTIVAGFALFAGVASGIVPALQIARSNAPLLLRGGQQVVAGGSRMRNLLLVVQLGLAQLLLVAGGLFVRSVDNLMTGAGYDIEQIIVATVELERQGYTIPDAWSKIDLFVERARQIPAVVNVGVSSDALLNSGGSLVAVGLRPVGTPNQTAPGRKMPMMNAVSPGYFATLGTRILRGRGFTAADNAVAKPVVIVDRGLAEADWPGQDAIGKCALIGSRPDCIEVVGISEPRRSGFISSVREEFFVPAAQATPYDLHTVPRTLLIRTSAPVREVIPSVVAALQSVVPEVPRRNVRPLVELADDGTRSWRLGASLFRIFGIAAAIMAGVGLYAALALTVRQRTAEIAVRMVLGATPSAVVGLVARHGLALFAAGWLFGALLMLLMSPLIERLLFNVTPTDAGVVVVVTLVMGTVTVLGSLLPAVRAARLSPSIALRQ